MASTATMYVLNRKADVPFCAAAWFNVCCQAQINAIRWWPRNRHTFEWMKCFLYLWLTETHSEKKHTYKSANAPDNSGWSVQLRFCLHWPRFGAYMEFRMRCEWHLIDISPHDERCDPTLRNWSTLQMFWLMIRIPHRCSFGLCHLNS